MPRMSSLSAGVFASISTGIPTNLIYSSRSMDIEDSISSVPSSTYWGDTDPLYFIGNSSGMTTALRFNNLNIPPGSTINSAYITVYAELAQSNNATAWLDIGAEQVDNASQLSGYSDHESRKSNLGTEIQWGPHSGISQNAAFTSPNLASVVQQIINRSGWAQGNSIQFFGVPNPSTTADYQFRSYWSGTQAANLIGYTPILEIDFTTNVDSSLTEGNIDVRTAADGDCVYLRVSPTTSYFVTDRLYVTDTVTPRDQTHFVRWQLNIPKDAIITDVSVTFYEGQSASYTTNLNFLRFSFEQVDNSGQVTSYANGASRYLNEGTNSIQSVPAGTFSTGNSHTFTLPPNMLQEIVSRSGWSSGNYVSLMLRNPVCGNGTNAQWRAHQGWSGTTTPRLQVTYLA